MKYRRGEYAMYCDLALVPMTWSFFVIVYGMWMVI